MSNTNTNCPHTTAGACSFCYEALKRENENLERLLNNKGIVCPLCYEAIKKGYFNSAVMALQDNKTLSSHLALARESLNKCREWGEISINGKKLSLGFIEETLEKIGGEK